MCRGRGTPVYRSAMAKKQLSETLSRKEKVKAAVDMRDVPEGTPGRVLVANGVTWVRYWVKFENGVEMGSIHRDKLVRADDWSQYLVDREHAASVVAEPGGTDAAPADGDAGAGDAEAGGGATVNGVEVPQLLLDRTTAALTRFGVSR